jgi:hypothetical protein
MKCKQKYFFQTLNNLNENKNKTFCIFVVAFGQMLLLSAFQCPGVCVIKHFTVVINGQLFARKDGAGAGAYPSEAPLRYSTLK